TLEISPSIPRGRVSAELTSQENIYTSPGSHVACANMQLRTSAADGFRISVSSTPSNSSQGSGPDDIESLGDVYLWGEIWTDGPSNDGNGNPVPIKTDVFVPKPLETNIVLDVHQISCGARHVALVTRQGEVFTCGEESGGRLGHGIERDCSHPKLVEFLAVTNVDFVACGEFHSCALSSSGDLYSWGDGTHNAGLLGQGTDVSHWIPKRVSGPLEGIQVLSVACGTWHTAFTTSTGKLFTFGEGTFGALGHGDRESARYPKEVKSLSGLKAVAVSCGVWHTAAIIEVTNQSAPTIFSKKLFTWGDGDKYRLGHGNKDSYLVPTCVSGLIDYNIHQLACGYNMTVALTTSGHVFTMGNNAYGQLGNPLSDGKLPGLVQDKLVGEFVEQISCGSHHVAALTSRSEVFTWGRGANGRLGHGDGEDRNVPTLIEAFRDRLVRNIACGSNYTASICIHKWISGADQSVCSSCRQAFGFTRKRHNCYNCGLVHCHACSSKKAMKAALAPTPGKPHRVCDSCFVKLKKAAEIGNAATIRRRASIRLSLDGNSRLDRHEVRKSRILLSPTVEPVKYLEVKSGGSSSTKSDNYSIIRASQVPSLLQLKDIAFPSSLSALQYALKPVSTAMPPPQQHQLPQIQTNSRPVSPYSRRPSPPRSTTPIFSKGVIETLKKTNDILNNEVSKLHGQVRNLKQKAEAQDTEIDKLRREAEEAALMAAERFSQCSKAVQTVKTISDQLKDISEKLPPEISLQPIHEQLESLLDIEKAQQSPEVSASSTDEPSSSHDEQKPDDDRKDTTAPDISEETPKDARSRASGISSRTAATEGCKEVIEQFEPGVYVTVLLLSDGEKIFKRVRFSKRRFAEQQAEEWWKGNKDRVLKKY
ncbi:hypothetical protein M569_12070, partial [Genlisea aurea]